MVKGRSRACKVLTKVESSDLSQYIGMKITHLNEVTQGPRRSRDPQGPFIANAPALILNMSTG